MPDRLDCHSTPTRRCSWLRLPLLLVSRFSSVVRDYHIDGSAVLGATTGASMGVLKSVNPFALSLGMGINCGLAGLTFFGMFPLPHIAHGLRTTLLTTIMQACGNTSSRPP